MCKYRVQKIQSLSPSVVLLTLENQSGRAFRFAAGQYVALHFKSHGRRSAVRCFSIVSSPYDPDTLQIAFRITGNYSYRLSQLKAGDSVYVQGPYGEFCIDTRYDRGLVFLAGGIGITPMMSMLLYVGQAKLNLPIRLLYSCRTASDVPFARQLIALEKQNPNLQVTFLIGDGMPEWKNEGRVVQGRIDATMLEQLDVPVDSTFFLCGPPPFMDGMVSLLQAADVEEDHIVIEAFGQRGLLKNEQHSGGFRWLYGATAASVVLGVGVLATHNVLAAHEAGENAAKPTTSSATTSGSSSGSSTSGSTAAPSTTSTNASSTSSSSSSAPTSSSSPTTTYSQPTSTQTYMQPVSSVS